MPVIYVGSTNCAQGQGNAYQWGNYAYAFDTNTGEDNAVTFMGSLEAIFPTSDAWGLPTNATITSIRVLFGRGDAMPNSQWEEEGCWDDYHQQWVGAQIDIYIQTVGGTVLGYLYCTWGTSLPSVSLGPSGCTSDYRAYTLPNAVKTDALKVFIWSLTGYCSIADICLEITYTETHGYYRDQNPPSTLTPRTILADNLWNGTSFVLPTTTNPAVFTPKFVTIKPDPQDPETWYEVESEYYFLGQVF